MAVQSAADPVDVVLELYRSYEPITDEHQWPWEQARWHELAFCILNSVIEPEVSSDAIRELTHDLIRWDLLDLETLASGNVGEAGDTVTTLKVLLRSAGFPTESADRAVAALGEAATGFAKAFGGLVQRFYREQGKAMVAELQRTVPMESLTGQEALEACSLWLQNTLNLPLPTRGALVDRACDRLGVAYEALLEAADTVGINVALLDDALRAYWADELEEEEFAPALANAIEEE